MLLYFGLSLFVSATLLFLVQPMIGKMILPQLGGTPAVWNTCMVFFQAVLLVGYGWTHLLTTTQPTRRQVIIQGCLLFLPFIVLPFSLGDWTPPADENPVFELLKILCIMVGLPFFLVSTTAPLLQKWFFHTGHPAAKDPYFLYGASNFGSMLGLAIYPTVVEPWLQVTAPEGAATWATQVHLWTFGYALFVALVVGCAVIVWQGLAGKFGPPAVETPPTIPEAPPPAPAPTPTPATAIKPAASKRRGKHLETPAPAAPTLEAPKSIAAPSVRVPDDNITLWRRLRWIGLAAAPSSLMLGLTTFMTTDIAAIAFFWIIPLALYLLTFIFVFARWWSDAHHTVIMFVQPCLLLFLVLKMIANLSPPTWAEFALHLGAFFSTTLMCHGELARERPSTKFLTEFYFWMSLGGVLGGLFNALFAPLAFQYGIWEYPAAMVLACLLRSNLVEDLQPMVPFDSTATRPTPVGYSLDFAIPIVVGVACYGLIYLSESASSAWQLNRYHIASIALVVIALAFGTTYLATADRKKGFDTAVVRWFFLSRDNPPVLAARILVVVVVVGLVFVNPRVEIGWLLRRSYLLAGLVVFALALSLRPVRFGLSVAALFIATYTYEHIYDDYLYEGRGFFGLLRVKETPVRNEREVRRAWGDPLPRLSESHRPPWEWKVYRRLIHGGINHGQQIVRFKWADGEENEYEETQELNLRKRRQPITYFHERNGIAELFYKLCWADAQPVSSVTDSMTGRSDARLPASMVGLGTGDFAAYAMLANTQSEPPFAVLGLGTGILASYAKPYQHVDVYEIDPLVKNLSIVPGYVPPWDDKRASMPTLPDPTFYFVYDAQERYAKIDVKLGDGRLKIKQAPQGYYHIIALDAFSSDAIPVHLLTKEAVQLYLDKLADGGVLIFNTTNRYVRIERVLAAIAEQLDLDCLYCSDETYVTDHPDRFSADWVVMQRKIKTVVDTTDGRSVAGWVKKENDFGLTLQTPDGDVALTAKEIKTKRHFYQNGGRPIGARLEQFRERVAWTGKVWFKEGTTEPIIDERWRRIAPLEGPAWTDGYSNMLNPRVMPWLTPWRN